MKKIQIVLVVLFFIILILICGACYFTSWRQILTSTAVYLALIFVVLFDLNLFYLVIFGKVRHIKKEIVPYVRAFFLILFVIPISFISISISLNNIKLFAH